MSEPTRTTSSDAHMSRWSARLRRWGRRVLIAIVVVLVTAVILALVLVHNLDRPAVRTRLQAFVHDKAGVDIDYGAVRVALLSGVSVEDVIVRSPEPLRGLAPELVHVKRVDAVWTSALYTGGPRRIEKVTVTGIELAVVMDENGKTSFDGLGPPGTTPPAKEKVGLSTQLHDAVASLKGIPAIEVAAVDGTLIRTEKGIVKERSSIRGLALGVTTDESGHARLDLGTEKTPLSLDIARDAAAANARFWLTVDATESDIALAADIAVTKQSFVEHVAPASLVHAEAKVHIEPSAHKLRIEVANTKFADGVATTTATLDLPDDGGPTLQHAEGEIDFLHALAVVPPELIPVAAKLSKGHVTYKVDALAVDKLPNLNPDARVAIEGDFAAVDVKDTAVISAATISAHVTPVGDGLKADAKISIAGAKARGIVADDVTVDLAATQAKNGALTGDVKVGFAKLDAEGVKAKTGRVTVKVADLIVDQKSPLASSGEVDIATTVASLNANPTALDNVAVRAHTKLTGKAPFAGEVDVAASDVRVSDGQKFIVNRPLHMTATIADATVDQTGTTHVVVDSGDIHLRLDATKGADSLDYDLETKAQTLGVARPFVPVTIAVEKMALALRSHGKLSGIASTPSISHHTEIGIEHVAADPVAAKSVAITLDSTGSAQKHELTASVAVEKLAGMPGLAAADEKIALSAAFDRGAHWAKAKIETNGIADANVAAKAAFDGSVIAYDVDANLGKLASLASLLTGVDLSQLAVAFQSHGTIGGVTHDGVTIDKDAARTAIVDGTVALKAHHIAWATGDAAFTTPALAIEGTIHADGDKRTFDGKLETDELRLANGLNTFEVSGFSDTIRAKLTGPVERVDVDTSQKIAIRVLKQDVAPMYSIGDATVDLAARRTHDGVIHISTFDVTNVAGGTSFALKGAVDTNEFARRLSLRGELKQDLAKLSNAPQKLAAKGEANVNLRVESPDLSIFRTTAEVKFQDASVQLPAAGVKIEGADGEVPILMSVRVTPKSVRIVREEEENPYSSLRFADQHPLLSRTSFIAIRRLELPQVTIDSLVGNFQIAQNIFSLRQFEMGIRGGHVTGQCALDWNGANTKLDMHVRADGVKSSHGEPFTGSAALIVSAGEHSVEGRADILQIGKRHLLDLLDVQDPFRVDPGLNRIRTALAFGYPDKLRLMFDHGFASVHIGFGGLARIITVDDLKGVPIGPLIDRFIPPFLPSKDD